MSTRKRRRSAVSTSDTAATAVPTSPWASSLPGDLLRLISQRVLAGDFLDYVRLRAVCTHWRSGTVSPRGRSVADPRFHPRRWLLFPEGHGLHPGHNKLRGHIRFINLDTGAFLRVRLPLFTDHCALDTVDGLVLLLRDRDAAVRLLHPLTGDLAELPPLSTLLTQVHKHDLQAHTEEDRWFFLTYGMSAAVSCDTKAGTTTVMIMFHRLSQLAFATSGQDRQWTMASWDVPQSLAPLPFQGKMYLVQFTGYDKESLIFRIDPPVESRFPPPPPKLIATCPAERLYDDRHLVECDSEIQLVGHSDESRSHIVIYRLEDVIAGRFVPVTSIQNRAIFLGGRSLSVSCKGMPTVMADTVVYREPKMHWFKQYHLASGTSSEPVDECGIDGIGKGPRSLIHHIITCCIRGAWNKGQIYSRKEESKDGWLVWKVKKKFRHWS